MLRSLVLVALVACAAATTAAPAATTAATRSCFSASVTVGSGSLCSGGSASYCTTTQDLANAAATAEGTTLTAITSTTAAATGAAYCTLVGGTATSYWTTASNVCKLSSCSSSVCGATAAPGATGQLLCCSYIKSWLSDRCSGIPASTTDAIKAGGTFAINSTIILAALPANTCADSNCISSASTVAYSVFAALIAAILALANL